MPRAIVLTILRRDQINLVDMSEIGSPISRGEVHVSDDRIAEFGARVRQVMQADFREGRDRITDALRTKAAESTALLQDIGSAAFSALLPENVCDRLRKTESALLYLRLDETLLEIPWEILHDGHDFLGHKHQLGRQFFTDSPIDASRHRRPKGSAVRLLLVCDAIDQQTGIVSEMQRLAALASQTGFADATLIQGPIEKSQLLAALQSHQVVHFAGRCDRDSDEQLDSGWLLQDDIINRTDLAALTEVPFLIFSETVNTLDDRAPSEQEAFRAISYGTACGFVSAGVPNVVDDCWPKRDLRDATFAESFYIAILSGSTIGAALRQARERIIYGHDAGGVSWARYVLYGDPETAPFHQANSLAETEASWLSHKEAERRQLTVMFCDLVGATELSERLDPEDWRDLVRRWQKACAGVIDEYQGYVAQYLGDGILVYFGFPVAHEDNAERAAHAAVDILRMLPRINEQSARIMADGKLQVRIGIHTGPVVVGEMGADESHDFIAMGATPNVAARLQVQADTDSALISESTYHLIHDRFDCERREGLTLAGVSEPVNAYRIVSARHSQEVADTLTPFVGREKGLDSLRGYWELACAGHGQIVTIVGDPGIGKSRLMREFNRSVVDPPHWTITSRCSPYFQNSAHYPLIETVSQLLRFERGDGPDTQLAKIENAMRRYNFDPAEAVPLLASLLAVSYAAKYDDPELSAEGARQRLEEILISWLLSEARARPVRYVVEDVQWIDPSTYSMLAQLIEQAGDTAILILVTYRPEPNVALASRTDLPCVRLDGLPRINAKEMVRAVAGTRALSSDIIDDLVIKTDGVPLFLEEYTLMVLDRVGLRRDGGWPAQSIPETLQDLLMERLDRLGDAKDTAQLASTVGRVFRYDVVKSLSPLAEDKLQTHLARLVDAGLVFERGEIASDQYVFKHVMMRDAAYASLLKGKREDFHRQIADYLISEAGPASDEPELLAYHLTEAGVLEQAIEAWLRAARKQAAKSAHLEAISHLNRAIELIGQLPDSNKRANQELEAQTALASCQIATKGYGASEVERAYNRALELCRQLDDRQRLIKVLLGLEGVYFMRGEFETAQQFADQSLNLAQDAEDAPRLAQAHWGLGCIYFHRGNFGQSQEHMARSIAYYIHDPSEIRRSAVQDAKIMCMCYTAWGLWELGFPQKALDTAYEVMDYADSLAHPFSQAEALDFAAAVHLFRREMTAARRLAEDAMQLCIKQDFPVWLALALVIRGRVMTEQGEIEDGLAHMRQGIDLWASTGALVTRPYYLAHLAEGLLNAGRIAEARKVVSEALDIVNRPGGTGERYYEAELTRLDGELYLKGENGKEAAAVAERRFRSAIDIARSQGTLSLELRSAVSLARLLAGDDARREDASKLVAGVMERFTEGLDTVDLREAKELLAGLS